MLQRYSFYFNYQTNFKFLKRKRDKKSAHATINGMRAIHSYLIIQVSQVNSTRPFRAYWVIPTVQVGIIPLPPSQKPLRMAGGNSGKC